MTQPELIIEFIKEQGSILPAKMAGYVFKSYMFGSETSKRCRELRKAGRLRSEQDGRFERFYLSGSSITDMQPQVRAIEGSTPLSRSKPITEAAKLFLSRFPIKQVEKKLTLF